MTIRSDAIITALIALIVVSFPIVGPIVENSSCFVPLNSAAKFFLNAPYLWGGRTPWGIDCSGLTQQVYKHFGIAILRDASQQATQGKTVNFLAEAKPGDLAFFDNAEGRIIHVGILLSPEEIIHASGRVKIDRIDNEGIYSEELGKRTHQLRIIKRFYQTQGCQ